MDKKIINAHLENVEVKNDADSEYYEFEGYASTFGNVDRGQDIIEKGAFTKAMKKLRDNSRPIKGSSYSKMIPILWQHNMDHPLGSFVEMREDDKGLYVKGIMPKDDEFVKGRVMPQLKIGSISDLSIGYIPKDCDYDGDIRRIKEADLLETSLVTIPMNEMAQITGFKNATKFQDLPLADRETEWDSDSAVDRVRDFLDSEDTPSASYRRAFLYYDQDDADNFGAYKLPIADVIDDRLVAVPRAIFAAAAALRGARGGVDLPDADRAGVIAHVNRYYDKMGMDSPFKESNSFRIDDPKGFTERELETLLKGGVHFSQKMAKEIISVLYEKRQRDVANASQRDADLLDSLKKLTETLN